MYYCWIYCLRGFFRRKCVFSEMSCSVCISWEMACWEVGLIYQAVISDVLIVMSETEVYSVQLSVCACVCVLFLLQLAEMILITCIYVCQFMPLGTHDKIKRFVPSGNTDQGV